MQMLKATPSHFHWIKQRILLQMHLVPLASSFEHLELSDLIHHAFVNSLISESLLLLQNEIITNADINKAT